MIPDGFFSNRPGLWRWGVGLICYSIFGVFIMFLGHLFNPNTNHTQGIIIASVSALTGIIFIALTAGKPRRQLPLGVLGLWDNRSFDWKFGLVLFFLGLFKEWELFSTSISLFSLGVMIFIEYRRIGWKNFRINTAIWWIGCICFIYQAFTILTSLEEIKNISNIYLVIFYNLRGIIGLIIMTVCSRNGIDTDF